MNYVGVIRYIIPSPKDVHILFLRTGKYVTLNGKRNFAVIKLWIWGSGACPGLSVWTQRNHTGGSWPERKQRDGRSRGLSDAQKGS